MSMSNPHTFTETGCYLDSHRGHYVTIHAIEFAIEHGFIVDTFAQFVIDSYEDSYFEENYPIEGLYELADDAIEWLNSSPTEREIKGQNMPPAKPENTHWQFWDGDFGLYTIDEDGEVVFD